MDAMPVEVSRTHTEDTSVMGSSDGNSLLKFHSFLQNERWRLALFLHAANSSLSNAPVDLNGDILLN